MKKYKLSYIFAVFFTFCFLVTVRWFDDEAASLFLVFGAIAITSTIINFRLNR